MPAATPHTAARSTRSQSPPRRVQRRPVTPIAATIATSSVIPYMCTDTGPRSSVPEDGDGMVARTLAIGRAFYGAADTQRLATGALEQDLGCEGRRTAAGDELESNVEVDVALGGELERSIRVVAGPQELLGAPPRHALDLAVHWNLDLGDIHAPFLIFGARPSFDVPL